jgi:hypothetical protein
MIEGAFVIQPEAAASRAEPPASRVLEVIR